MCLLADGLVPIMSGNFHTGRLFDNGPRPSFRPGLRYPRLPAVKQPASGSTPRPAPLASDFLELDAKDIQGPLFQASNVASQRECQKTEPFSQAVMSLPRVGDMHSSPGSGAFGSRAPLQHQRRGPQESRELLAAFWANSSISRPRPLGARGVEGLRHNRKSLKLTK